MKYFKYILFYLLIITSLTVSAQRRKPKIKNLEKYDYQAYHFGFSLGYNQMDFTIKTKGDLSEFDSLYVVESKPESGFNIGIVTNLRINNNLDLRFVPSLSFGERNLLYTVNEHENEGIVEKPPFRIETTNVEFPFNIKFKSVRMTNNRVYMLAGVKWSIDLASQSGKKNDKNIDLPIKLKSSDFAYEIGAGLDFYLEYFKFAIELKMAYGIRNLLSREQNLYNKPIDKIRSKIFILSFTFE